MYGLGRFLLAAVVLSAYVAVAGPYLSGAGLPGAPWQGEWWKGALAFLLSAADFSSNLLAVAARLILGLLFAGVLSAMESRRTFLRALGAELALVAVWWLWPSDAEWYWKVLAFLISLLVWALIGVTELVVDAAPPKMPTVIDFPAWIVMAIALPIAGSLAGSPWGYLLAFLGTLVVAPARWWLWIKPGPPQPTAPSGPSAPATPPPPTQAIIPATANPTPPSAPAPAPDLSAVREETRRALEDVTESLRRAEHVMRAGARGGRADPEVQRKHEALKKQKADLESTLQSLPPAGA